MVTFSYGTAALQYETILTAAQAAEYTYEKIVGTWNPATETQQIELAYTENEGAVQWEPTSATLFLVEYANGEANIVTELPSSMPVGTTVRAANTRGGFGPAAGTPKPDEQGIEEISQELKANSQKLIHNGHVYIIRDGRIYNILGVEIK